MPRSHPGSFASRCLVVGWHLGKVRVAVVTRVARSEMYLLLSRLRFGGVVVEGDAGDGLTAVLQRQVCCSCAMEWWNSGARVVCKWLHTVLVQSGA
eukprot:2666739-Amphidinium_carterae.1